MWTSKLDSTDKPGYFCTHSNIYLTTPQTPARTTFGPSTLSPACSNPCVHIPATSNVLWMLRYVNEVSTMCPPTQLLIPYILGLRCQVSGHQTQDWGKFKILRSDGQAEVLPRVEKDNVGESNDLVIKSLSEATKSYLPLSRSGLCTLWLLLHMVNTIESLSEATKSYLPLSRLGLCTPLAHGEHATPFVQQDCSHCHIRLPFPKLTMTCSEGQAEVKWCV